MKFTLTGTDGWFDLLRPGEFHNEATVAGETRYVLQVVAPEDLADLIALWEEQGKPELLIDREHESHKPGGNSEALGWMKGLRLSPAGVLQAQARWSAAGLALLEGGSYRYCSASVKTTPMDGANGNGATREDPVRVRLVVLSRIGLTNLPAVDGLLPISNSLPADAAGGGTQPAALPATTQPKKMTKLAALLGLPETATEDELAAALQSLIDAGKAATEEGAEATMEEFKNCVPESSRSFFKEMLVTNRKVTLEVLNGLKAAAETNRQQEEVRVHNRAGAGVVTTPAGVKDAPGQADRSYAQKAAVIDVLNRSANKGMTHTAAFEVACGEKPELFAAR
jgi:phage I-like protein